MTTDRMDFVTYNHHAGEILGIQRSLVAIVHQWQKLTGLEGEPRTNTHCIN